MPLRRREEKRLVYGIEANHHIAVIMSGNCKPQLVGNIVTQESELRASGGEHHQESRMGSGLHQELNSLDAYLFSGKRREEGRRVDAIH